MSVSCLRRWWGSWRLLLSVTGLALLAITVGAGSGMVTAGPVGPSSATSVTVAAGSDQQLAAGVPVTDCREPDGVVSSVATQDGSEAGTAVDDKSHGSDAPSAVFVGRLPAGASPRRTTACGDVAPLVGSACAPCGPRAPPLRQA